PALSRSTNASHPHPKRCPVYSVNTRDSVRSGMARKLWGPVYRAGNTSWDCSIRLICPEIHQALDSSCENIVVAGTVSDNDAGGETVAGGRPGNKPAEFKINVSSDAT